MTVKFPWTDRRGRTLPTIERPNINLPSVDLSNVQVPRPSMRIDVSGLHAPEMPDIRLPNMDIRRVDLPRVDLPNIDLPHVDLPDVDFGGVGRAVSDALSGIAESLSDTLSDTGDRAREAVTSMASNLPADMPFVSRFRPKPRSRLLPALFVVGAASAVAATLAGIYALFASPSGARRRAALRRRLQATPGAAQRGIGAAVGSARQVGDKAVELVRVPIETARDMVSNHSDEIEPNDGTPNEVLAVNAIDVAALESDADSPIDMTAVAIENEAAQDGFTDADAAASIYGEPTILSDDEGVELREEATEESAV